MEIGVKGSKERMINVKLKDTGLEVALVNSKGFPGGSVVKSQCRRHKRHGFNLWVRKIPWSRK